MTTIATDGKTIAADGQGVSGHERTRLNACKIKIVNGTIYAFTGTFKFFDSAIAWHQGGCQGDPPRIGDGKADDNRWTLLIPGADAIDVYTSDDGRFCDSFPYPQAFGSGSNYALGALHAGKSPRKAIEIASKLDVMTGGEITVINIAEALGLPSAEVVPLRG